jgi:hypothetical protein
VRAAAAYLWDASVPVEMDEIDSMDKLDAALASSSESNHPLIIDWYHLCSVLSISMLRLLVCDHLSRSSDAEVSLRSCQDGQLVPEMHLPEAQAGEDCRRISGVGLNPLK